MDQKHRKAIQANFQSLVARTDLDSMVTALYEKGVFSEQMIEKYRDNNESSWDRKRKLYMDIMCRGPQAFGHLIDTLSEMGYWDLVSDLDPDHPVYSFTRPPNSSNSVSRREPRPESTEHFVSITKAKTRTKTELQKKYSLDGAQATVTPDTLPPEDPLHLDNAPEDLIEVKFKVNKSTKFMEEHHDGNDLKLYKTRGRNRGVMLIFSYVSFKNNIENVRHGADVDCASLKNVFSEMGFKVISYPDLTYQETIETLRSLEDVLVDVECVFTVVSSHGYERKDASDVDIRCSDGKLINVRDILSYFDNKSLPRLVGIPKVFVFQVCRGGSRDFAWSSVQLGSPAGGTVGGAAGGAAGEAVGVAADGRAPRAAPPRPAARPAAPLPVYSDILIAHSTLPGFASHRDHKLGSWYIQAMCAVFAARAHDTHVDKLFTLVDQRLRDLFSVQTSSVDRWGFNRRLYLHPGLFE